MTITLYRQLATKAEEDKKDKNHENNSKPKGDHTIDNDLHLGKNNMTKGKLSKLKPAGAAETLGAMVDNQGNLITEHESMADLRCHAVETRQRRTQESNTDSRQLSTRPRRNPVHGMAKIRQHGYPHPLASTQFHVHKQRHHDTLPGI